MIIITITTDAGTKVDYPIDCALEERISYEAEVTENEVQKGSPLTDHIYPKRPVLEFDGVVSNTPIGKVALDPTRRTDVGVPKPANDAYARFVDIHEAATTVVVTCSYGKFEGMAMNSLTSTKTDDSANAFKFTAKFKEIRIVDNKRTTVRAAVPNGGGKGSLGAREAILKYVGKHVVWVKSIRREPGAPPYIKQLVPAHKPTKDGALGSPILSTSPYDRNATAGAGNVIDNYYYDHYRLAAGDKETDRTMLLADGYVLLQDTGPKPQAGIRANAKRGYYRLNGTYPSTTDYVGNNGAVSVPLDANGNPIHKGNPGVTDVPVTPSPVLQNPGQNSVTDGNGSSLTKRPPSPAAWGPMLGNNQ